MKLMVLDGNSIVNRAFYGVRMLNAPDGTPTNAVFGFLNILTKLMNEEKPDALCVTFDMHAPTFRHLQYDGYKAQRKGMPEELAAQMPILKETLDAMNIRRYELEGWEADDLIGTIGCICGDAGWDCVAVTGDKDSFQLIDEHVAVKHVKSRMGQTEVKLYDKAAFEEEYGFEPKKMVDLKALMGDASDNIPGVAGIGEKTALDLIRRFGTVAEIYENIDTIDVKDGIRNKLKEGKASAEMSYDLATIRCCADIPFKLEDNAVRSVDNDALYTIFKRLGFRKLIESYKLTPPKEKAENGEPPTEFKGECVSVEINSDADIEKMKSHVESCAVAVKLTDEGDICAVVAGDTGFIIKDASPVYRAAMEAVFSGNVKKMGHNVKDVMGWLLKNGFSTDGWIFDSALAAYLIDPTAGGYDLDFICEKYCGFVPMEAAGSDGQMSLLADDTETVAKLLSDAAAIICLEERLMPKLNELGLTKVFEEIEMPLCPVLAEMERNGFLVNKEALSEFGEVLSTQINDLQNRIYEIAGETFNINSPKQLGEILFDKLMLPHGKKTKTGWSTNADILEKLRNKHEIVGYILEYRELAKLKSTYADGLLKVIASDGRIHTKFQMTVTATGRLSSVEPNLQNIPIRRELGGEIRKMFVAGDGNVLVDADYSQIELRILAHISGDEAMRSAFLDGRDIHRATASQVFSVPYEEVTPKMRSSCKAVNFGIVYGISAFSLSEDLGVPVYEAKEYIDKYLDRYCGVRDYMEKVAADAKESGEVRTVYGRRRPMPELASSNFNLRAFGERVARNMPIQGTAADIMKIAMIKVFAALKKEVPESRVLLQVHDELIVECPEALAEKTAQVLKREMEAAAEFAVPLLADANTGKSWFEAK